MTGKGLDSEVLRMGSTLAIAKSSLDPLWGHPIELGAVWGQEEQDPMGLPYKWLANEIMRRTGPTLAIANYWDILDLPRSGTLYRVTL